MGSGMRATQYILFGDLITAIRQEADVSIAFVRGVGLGVVKGWRRSLNIPEPKSDESAKGISPVKRKQIETLLLAGMSVGSVAETAQVTAVLVRKIKGAL